MPVFINKVVLGYGHITLVSILPIAVWSLCQQSSCHQVYGPVIHKSETIYFGHCTEEVCKPMFYTECYINSNDYITIQRKHWTLPSAENESPKMLSFSLSLKIHQRWWQSGVKYPGAGPLQPRVEHISTTLWRHPVITNQYLINLTREFNTYKIKHKSTRELLTREFNTYKIKHKSNPKGQGSKGPQMGSLTWNSGISSPLGVRVTGHVLYHCSLITITHYHFSIVFSIYDTQLYMLSFFLTFFKLKYSWFTMIQVYSKVIQLHFYIQISSFSDSFPWQVITRY